jgi:hypothetical protein
MKMQEKGTARTRKNALMFAALMFVSTAAPVRASDHLDTRTVVADPRADIGDLFAWMSPTDGRLNLVMTLVGHTFSHELEYAFHIDSGTEFGRTNATTSIKCRLDVEAIVECEAGEADSVRGDATGPQGLESKHHRFRVFIGLRDDPFFNNVKGSRDAYQKAATALRAGARVDAAGCPLFDKATSAKILDEWRHTDGGPAKDFLIGWTPASLVVSVDLNAVARGGKMLAVWATTSSASGQVDRMGRPLTGNAMLAPIAADEVSDGLKEAYNKATPVTSAAFVPEIEKTLGLYDGFDGMCGNQLLAKSSEQSPARYRALAKLLADDRLWINSDSTKCTQFFAVELAHLGGQKSLAGDCGGRTPNYDAVDVYRSLLANGTTQGVDDGVDRDDHEHSTTRFPFLSPVH